MPRHTVLLLTARRRPAGVLALVLVLSSLVPATPAAATEPVTGESFPLEGFIQPTPGTSSITVTAAFEAPPGGTIRDLRIRLEGPGTSVTLFAASDAGKRVEWFGERSSLARGSYTLTVEAAVIADGRDLRGRLTRTVGVGLAEPVAGRARPDLAPPDFPGAPRDPGRELTAADTTTDGDLATAAINAVPASADVVVYGATPSGVLAAVAAARSGASVILVEATGHVGGMMANGLTATDYGHPTMIGGITDEFFDRMEAHEGSAYGRWRFQPSSAEAIFLTMLAEAGVSLVVDEPIHETNGVEMDGTTIRAIHTGGGRRVAGTTFVDASYEGDLMAQAGVTYRIGRESSAEHDETRAGVGVSAAVFTVPPEIDPAVPLAAPTGPVGSGDDRIQNSNYRLCFSASAGNQVPFAQPRDYDPARYDLPAAYIASRVGQGHTPDLTWFLWPVATTNGKYDVNNNGPVSIGVHGLNTAYPDGSTATRRAIADELESYTRGFLHFLRYDQRVPSRIRDQMAGYGLCADEFVDNDNWPRIFYLREGRRMAGRYLLTERDVLVARAKTDTIAIASYAFDSHHISRWIDGSRRLRLEGGFWAGRAAATRWSIPYRSLTPAREEATNLLVSVTVSVTHVADASLRMEPQYMLMGEAAGTAAAMASGRLGSQLTPRPVQDVPVETLRNVLRQRGSVVDNYLFWDSITTPFRGDIERTFLDGVTFGCSPINFCPTAATTREVMAAWLTNALDLPPATRDYFTDDEASPYEDAINRLAAARITGGCSATTFCPGGSVTRGQMAAFLNRAFRLPPTSTDFFTDDETSIFEGDINELAASRITGGCGGTRFCPTAIVTREQMAAFLRRALD